MKSVTSAARQNNLNLEKEKIKAEKAELKHKLAEKFGDRFKPVKKGDSTVVLSKEAIEKSKTAAKNDMNDGVIKSNDPNSEETKEKLRGLLATGSFQFNEKEKDALEEILG